MDTERLWKNTQEELKISLAPAIFQTFVLKTQLISIENNVATIGCPNTYSVDFNKKRHYDIIKNALDNQTKADNILNFIVQETIKTDSDANNTPLFSYSPNRSNNSSLHPKYTFDTLVVGNSNNFAFAAAQGIVKTPVFLIILSSFGVG